MMKNCDSNNNKQCDIIQLVAHGCFMASNGVRVNDSSKNVQQENKMQKQDLRTCSNMTIALNSGSLK